MLYIMMLWCKKPVGSTGQFPSMCKLLCFIVVAFMFAGCAGRKVSDKSIEVIGGLELRQITDGKKRESVILVDPRHPEDFARGHLPGAQNIRLSDLPLDSKPTGKLSRYDAIVVYGDNPGSIPAKAMAKRLLAIGYSGVKFFPGGIEEWVNLGGVVERGQVASERGE